MWDRSFLGSLVGKRSGSQSVGGSTGVAGGLDFVNCWFLRAWSRWHLIVAAEDGDNLRRVIVVSPIKWGRYPRSSADFSVERTGETMWHGRT